MRSFGFKIVDRHRSEIQPILEKALLDQCPVEIGFYFHDPQANEFIWQTLQHRELSLNTHLDHRVYRLSNLHEHMQPLAAEIDRIKKLGSDYSIIHVAPSPFTIQPENKSRILESILPNLRALNDLCERKHYAVYVENTFGGVSFYRELFTRITAENLRSINFCFDIGHAKIWSGNNLSSWLGFLEDLTGEGCKLHFHLHNNRGRFDDHLSFVESETEGLNTADAYTGSLDYLQTLNRIEQQFPDSRKIFEVKAQLAIANLEYVTGDNH